MKKHRLLVLMMCIAMASCVTGCKDSKPDGTENTEEVTNTITEPVEEVSKVPEVYLEDYNLRVLQDADLDFMIVSKNADKIAFSESDISLPEGVGGEPMIVESEPGIYEVLIFGVTGNAGRYSLTIPGTCFGSTENGNAADLVVPFCIDNKNISDKVRLTCTPSAVEVEKGGTLTCLLEYEGDIASYNLGDISVTCHGFTADVSTTLSSTSNEHMLVLSNIQLAEDGAETYFDLCEGTAFDSENKPCNSYIVDVNIVDEVEDTFITLF